MSTARNSKPGQRFDASFPCPVCGGHDDAARGQGERCYGFLSGEWIHCTRHEHAGVGNQYHAGSNTYSHKLNGPCPCGQEHRPAIANPGAKKPFEVARRYDYTDDAGTLIYQVEKSKDKRFRQRRPDPSEPGGWAYNLKGVARTLYRLTDLIDADPGRTVCIPEGVKDVDRLRLGDQVATTNSGGAGKWDDISRPTGPVIQDCLDWYPLVGVIPARRV